MIALLDHEMMMKANGGLGLLDNVGDSRLCANLHGGNGGLKILMSKAGIDLS